MGKVSEREIWRQIDMETEIKRWRQTVRYDEMREKESLERATERDHGRESQEFQESQERVSGTVQAR